MTNDVKENKGLIEEMLKVGAQYGYGKTRRHPSTTPFIFTTKNRVDIIDIEKTKVLLDKSLEFVKSLAKDSKVLLMVGTKPECRKAIKENAEEIEMPYVTEHWTGGTITNFSEIKKRLQELKDLREQKEKGELEKYKKHEQLKIEKKIEKMEKNFSGIVGMERAPDVVFIVDPKHEQAAVREARRKEIPIIALASSDCNIDEIDYPIVANDAAMSSIEFFVEKIAEAYSENKGT